MFKRRLRDSHDGTCSLNRASQEVTRGRKLNSNYEWQEKQYLKTDESTRFLFLDVTGLKT